MHTISCSEGRRTCSRDRDQALQVQTSSGAHQDAFVSRLKSTQDCQQVSCTFRHPDPKRKACLHGRPLTTPSRAGWTLCAYTASMPYPLRIEYPALSHAQLAIICDRYGDDLVARRLPIEGPKCLQTGRIWTTTEIQPHWRVYHLRRNCPYCGSSKGSRWSIRWCSSSVRSSLSYAR